MKRTKQYPLTGEAFDSLPAAKKELIFRGMAGKTTKQLLAESQPLNQKERAEWRQTRRRLAKRKAPAVRRTIINQSQKVRSSRKDLNQYPKGQNRKGVEALIAHYENQSDDEAIAEMEASRKNTAFTMMAIPIELVPQVRKLLSKRAR